MHAVHEGVLYILYQSMYELKRINTLCNIVIPGGNSQETLFIFTDIELFILLYFLFKIFNSLQ